MTEKEKQQYDSDTIYMQILSCDCKTIEEAKEAICLFYVPDMSISRAGISHAVGRLEKYYKK